MRRLLAKPITRYIRSKILLWLVAQVTLAQPTTFTVNLYSTYLRMNQVLTTWVSTIKHNYVQAQSSQYRGGNATKPNVAVNGE